MSVVCVLNFAIAELRQAKSAHGSLRETKCIDFSNLIVGGFSDFIECPILNHLYAIQGELTRSPL